jgi:hypothetical protein
VIRAVSIAVAEARPDAAGVLKAQGLPDDALAPRLRAVLDQALREFEALARPRAVLREISAADFAAVLDGAGARESVVGRVHPKAEALALFVATLGEPVCRRIREHFDRHELAEGWMLDAVASAGADRLADLLAARFRATLAGRGGSGARVLPYSPGYCGWDTRGQKALFKALEPGEIGVTLNDSCLMSPIKSVSGVLVSGAAEIHRFRPEFPFCDHCRTHACGPRMASVLRQA